MADREKILKGLEYCSKTVGKACPWECPYRVECMMQDDRLHMYSVMYDALELLREQPEQKHGHWKGFTQSRYYGKDDYGEPIFRDGRFYICSECRRKSIIKYPYCPRCGAKMEEEVTQDG